MDKVTLLLGILIGAVVILYFTPVWRDFSRPEYEGFTSSSSSFKAKTFGSSSSSSSSSSSDITIGSSSSSTYTAATAPAKCPPPPNIEDAVSKAITDALGKLGGGGSAGRNKKHMNLGASPTNTADANTPLPAPPLNMEALIKLSKSLMQPGISADYASVRNMFTTKYGTQATLQPTDHSSAFLIYIEYSNFYTNFYNILDESNKAVFRRAPIDQQATAISMINTFGLETMIYLHQQLDPNFEADFGDDYEGEDDGTGSGTGSGAGSGTCKDNQKMIDELRGCLTSSDVNCVQKVLDKYSETNITNVTNTINKPSPDENEKKPGSSSSSLKDNTVIPPGGSSSSFKGNITTPPPGGSSSSYKYTPPPTAPVGSSSSYGLVIPPVAPGPTSSSSGSMSYGATATVSSGLGGGEEECTDGDVEVVVKMQPPPAAAQSSCPVCDGSGCNLCSGTGSPSLGQGANWNYITPQVSKCKSDEPIDMRWGY